MGKFTGFLKMVGATFVLCQGLLMGIPGAVLTWKGDADMKTAEQIYVQTEEYAQLRELEDARIQVYKDRFDELETRYYKGDVSTEEYKDAKDAFNKEMDYTQNEFLQEKIKETDNAEVKALLKNHKLELGFGIALCVLSGISFIGKAVTTGVQNAMGGWEDDYGNPATFTTGRWLTDKIKEGAEELKGEDDEEEDDEEDEDEQNQPKPKKPAKYKEEVSVVENPENELGSIEDIYYKE